MIKRLRISSHSASAIMLFAAFSVLVLASVTFEVLGFGWFAWSVLGLFAIMVVSRAVFEIDHSPIPLTKWKQQVAAAVVIGLVHVMYTIGYFALIGYQSLLSIIMYFVGIYLMWELVDRSIGAPPQEEVYSAAITIQGKPVLSETDKARLFGAIEHQWKSKTAAQVSWPPAFDWDRLELVLAELNGKKIIVVPHDATDDGEAHADASELWRRRGASKSGFLGYVYYRKQDVDGVVRGLPLHLGFGSFDERLDMRDQVKLLIIGAFEQAGFHASATTDDGHRIAVYPHEQRQEPLV